MNIDGVLLTLLSFCVVTDREYLMPNVGLRFGTVHLSTHSDPLKPSFSFPKLQMIMFSFSCHYHADFRR